MYLSDRKTVGAMPCLRSFRGSLQRLPQASTFDVTCQTFAHSSLKSPSQDLSIYIYLNTRIPPRLLIVSTLFVFYKVIKVLSSNESLFSKDNSVSFENINLKKVLFLFVHYIYMHNYTDLNC